ncbi:MAG: hypothetical protein U0T77_10050 [Chitinophagales bacterium]
MEEFDEGRFNNGKYSGMNNIASLNEGWIHEEIFWMKKGIMEWLSG